MAFNNGPYLWFDGQFVRWEEATVTRAADGPACGCRLRTRMYSGAAGQLRPILSTSATSSGSTSMRLKPTCLPTARESRAP